MKNNSYSKVLALKYRPQSFKDLIGQNIVAETIKNSIKAGLKGIFVKKGKNVFLQRDKCIKLADKHNFFISVF